MGHINFNLKYKKKKKENGEDSFKKKYENKIALCKVLICLLKITQPSQTCSSFFPFNLNLN